MKIIRLLYLFLLATIFLAVQPVHALSSVNAQGNAPLVLVLNADTAVTPAMEEYVTRGLSLAEQQGAELVIIHLNTPGGDTLATTSFGDEFSIDDLDPEFSQSLCFHWPVVVTVF